MLYNAIAEGTTGMQERAYCENPHNISETNAIVHALMRRKDGR